MQSDHRVNARTRGKDRTLVLPSPHVMDQRLISAIADRYRIKRELGAGGMATVYLADDLRHGREVAVKVLRPELAAALGHDRFLREITTTANLRHPNILPLFDSGEIDGHVFYVMPLIEGESLRDRIAREGALPIDDVLRIVDEVADALSYAHERNVIHRDIKPENIMLERGHAIVADFGIAHAASTSGNDQLTMAGMVLGTPHYMSPEQGSADTVDGRSDLYSLACVTYEMLTGRPPFTAPTPIALLVQHAVQPVPSIHNARPDAPSYIVTAIERALCKAPDDRQASVAELRETLKRESITLPVMSPGTLRKPPPMPATPLLGREDLIVAAINRIENGTRVLSITGYGGTGKTRFAIELYRRLEAEFADGAAFVSIASVTQAADVMPTISTTLDISEAHGRSAVDAMCTVIGDRHVLIVLDNFEQVLGAAEEVAELVSRCPRLVVIATSRAPLKIGAESEFVLPPLELPDLNATLSAMGECPSVALFVERGQKVKPGFVLTASNAPSIAAICRQLDGLPLALELAAARVRILDPAVLLKRLDSALDLLTSGDRDLPLRQRTLRATISWSYSLLDSREQRLLRRVSVFHEGWTLEALEQVCYAGEKSDLALNELDSLVEKGLVRVISNSDRYSLLETIRAFSAEQLHAAGEVETVRDAHADYFLTFAGMVDAGIKGTTQIETMRLARIENANLYAAINWLTAKARAGDMTALEKGLLLSGHLNWFWHISGQHLTARVLLDELLALAANHRPSRGRALALLANGMISTATGAWERSLEEWSGAFSDAHAVGDLAACAEGKMGVGYSNLSLGQIEASSAALEEAIALSENPGTGLVRGIAVALKGMLHYATGDLETGIANVERAIRIHERDDDHEGRGVALSLLAQMTFAKGDHPHALDLYQKALTSLETVGDYPEIARVWCEMGWTALASGDGEAAQQAFVSAVRKYEVVGSARGIGLAIMGLAAVEAAAGRSENAVAIAAAADALSTRAGVVVEHPMDPGVAARIEGLKASIPKGTLDGLLVDAVALTPAAVLALVASGA